MDSKFKFSDYLGFAFIIVIFLGCGYCFYSAFTNEGENKIEPHKTYSACGKTYSTLDYTTLDDLIHDLTYNCEEQINKLEIELGY